jgi:nickel transport protein
MNKFITPKYLARLIFYLFLFVGMVCIHIEMADAHRVNVFAWVEEDTVYVESKFKNGRQVKAGKITVFDSKGSAILTGTTDENGKFSFKAPHKTRLKIVLDAGAGHRAEWTIAAHEINTPIAGQKPAAGKDTTIQNIFIGLGLIFGLTVIAGYFRNRKKKGRENTKS